MASGHVNRTKRPNTWLHRPSLRREDFSCQPGAVHTWHKTDIDPATIDVCYRGQSRHQAGVKPRPLLTAGSTGRRARSAKMGRHSGVCQQYAATMTKETVTAHAWRAASFL